MLHPSWSSIYYIIRAGSAFAKKSDGPVRVHQMRAGSQGLASIPSAFPQASC
jgi:hypothetical protein